MVRRKRIAQSDITGEKGIALIHQITLDMGFVWNPTKLEAGIDGYIEVRDHHTAEVSNCILQVQSKAGPSWFKAETEATFEFICDERDLNYWLAGNCPVVLVVSRPDIREAYWVSLKDYFRDPLRRKARKIVFDKAHDKFNADCRERLAQLAIRRTSGLYLNALPRDEVLISNLLPVQSFPRRLFRAKSSLRFPHQVWDRLGNERDPRPREWLLHNGSLYAFHDLTMEPWKKACSSSTTENLSSEEWSRSSDPNQRHVFVRLLTECLTALLHRQGVRFSRNKEHYFFEATRTFTERKVGGLSVFKPYSSKTDSERIAHYRHRAMKSQFVRFERRWYLEITPSYHFTLDGIRLSRFFEERLSGIKKLERQNKTHLRQLHLWEEVLRQTYLRSTPSVEPPTYSLFDDSEEISAVEAPEPYPYLDFEPLVQFNVDYGVPETAWLAAGDDALAAEDESGQRMLFD